MSLRPGRSIKRYVIIVGLVFIIGYMGSLQVNTRESLFHGGSLVPHDNTEPIHMESPEHIIDTGIHKEHNSTSSSSTTADKSTTAKLIQNINQKYCGANQCQFLLPIAITEQESKAQYHFRQLAFLSGKLGRTIVLPNVHGSHLGACRQQPFDYYYDHSWLDKNNAHFNYITMAQFKAWINERQLADPLQKPTGREVFIELNDASSHLSKTTNCFKEFFDFTDRPRTRFQLEDPEQQSRRAGNFTQIFLDVLRHAAAPESNKNDNSSGGDGSVVDVMHVYYDRRFGYIEHPQVEHPLKYHARWHAISDQIAAQLSPFVAVHWRMERLAPLKNLQPCAEQLVQQLQQHAQEKLDVFLLTDYPHLLTSSIAKPESMSFKLNELRREHHDAIRYLYQNANVSLTTILSQADLPTNELPPPDNWHLISVDPLATPPDKSVLGIVDKLVAMRAKWFLYGEPGVCGKQSSFTRRITAERMHAYRSNDPMIASPADIFRLP